MAFSTPEAADAFPERPATRAVTGYRTPGSPR
jgi:hypothetical protein